MKNVSDEHSRENQTHFVSSTFFLEIRAVYEIKWKIMYSEAGHNKNMAHAHCMLDTQDYKYAHTGFVALNAFPVQQWLQDRASMLRYTHFSLLVSYLSKLIIRVR